MRLPWVTFWVTKRRGHPRTAGNCYGQRCSATLGQIAVCGYPRTPISSCQDSYPTPGPTTLVYSEPMSVADRAPSDRAVRWGLAAKLFATLILLSAIAVLVSAVLGYVRGRDALEEAIYNQLTAARQAKARQVETYFRTTRDELRLLASTKMVADAMHAFRDSFDELDKAPVSDELRSKVRDWYSANVLPELKRLFGKDAALDDYLPVGNAATYLQYHYIVANPHPADQRSLLD